MRSGTFYFAGAANDWTAPSNNALWQDALKTLFDPCPPGWRVPQSGESNRNPWIAFTTANSTYSSGADGGRQWDASAVSSSSNVWYPCSGTRSQTSWGNIYSTVGNTGYYWSALFLDTNGNRFRFNNQSVLSGVSSSGARSDAYPVRCIRE